MHSTRRGMERKDWEEPTKRKTGPNDMNHVVWAIGAFFFFSLYVFLCILNHVYRFHRYCRATEGHMGGYDKENGPKRHVSCRLCH